MRYMADLLVGFVALEHVGFLFVEMFLWRKPLGLRIFRLTQEAADSSAVLAANQGLYNGFLAAGLVWGLFFCGQPAAVKTFFLCCVVVAGVFGGVTASRSILYVQALPALLALVLLRLGAAN